MLRRLQKIEEIVGEVTLSNEFKISNKSKKQMIKQVENEILSWQGINFNFCKNQKRSYKEYEKTSINWFNRNKAKIYGNYFLSINLYSYFKRTYLIYIYLETLLLFFI